MITRHVLTIPATGRKVHYRRCGSGPLLLMVHQSPRSSAEYERLMGNWTAHFTCVAPDTPGFGQSDPLPGEPDIADFADALDEFLGALEVGTCAAYGFHSGGIILITALKRRSERFSAVAVGGYAVWTEEEMRVFGERYLPSFLPSSYGEHLVWAWNRILEQSWFFPWFDLRDANRLPHAHADAARTHAAVMELLDAGDAYRAGYRAVLRAPRDIPPPDTATPPVLITAYHGDPLQEHLARLGTMPANWRAAAVATADAHESESLAFLVDHAGAPPASLAEDAGEGWLAIGDGLIHWRGARGADRLVLHDPAAELSEPAAGEVAIDVPGHGLSSQFEDVGAVIEAAREALGARLIVWPAVPEGDPSLLYPDLSPERFGSHLIRAWSAARAEALFRPWYAVEKVFALPVQPAAIAPEAIAVRARARLRAGGAALRYHQFLASRTGDGR